MKLPQISHNNKNSTLLSIIETFLTNCFYPMNFMAGTNKECFFVFLFFCFFFVVLICFFGFVLFLFLFLFLFFSFLPVLSHFCKPIFKAGVSVGGCFSLKKDDF